jgi:hypothetical protein
MNVPFSCLLVPDEGVTYQETHLEKYVVLRQEIVEFLNTVIRRRRRYFALTYGSLTRKLPSIQFWCF